ncbi:MAG: hypothetical protein LCH63_07570 [Candidatus Melainabacteria bacterium]|uniref:Uncharacterized protein n=1 Tax=Candidatus Obscuribacter phosphatis TaxID=1906157 RepID=A0A8J7PAB3_9BACT|nr:hypothetical protein [Candidatus Obscuribacter phosphatis]MBX9939599.1 hypothetical protein [Candidatus Obscuribacterales bacterium]MCA0313687.1 hypothetical protein [Candidatus Melainabacteria bacterium]OPZ89862.1 MAG: hypothetical protein BWY75_00983 [bacterium ADurb.Bin425]
MSIFDDRVENNQPEPETPQDLRFWFELFKPVIKTTAEDMSDSLAQVMRRDKTVAAFATASLNRFVGGNEDDVYNV